MLIMMLASNQLVIKLLMVINSKSLITNTNKQALVHQFETQLVNYS